MPFFLWSLLTYLFSLHKLSIFGLIIRIGSHILQHAHVFGVAFVKIHEILVLETWGAFFLVVLISYSCGWLWLDV